MNLSEILWSAAFCLFLLGGAWSFRSDGAWPAVVVMGLGALVDAAVAFLPQLGVEALSYNLQGINGAMIASMVAGVTAYMLFLVGVWFRWRQRLHAFHLCIALAQPVWFVSFIGFLFALYILPDALLR